MDKQFKRSILVVTYAIALVFLVMHVETILSLLSTGVSILSPFIVGAALAFVLSIPMGFLERTIFKFEHRPKLQKSKRVFSFLVSLILVLFVIFIVVFLLVPQLGSTFDTIVATAPVFAKEVYQWVLTWDVDWIAFETWLKELQFDYQSLIQKAATWAQGSATGMLNSTVGVVSTVAVGIFNGVISFIFAIYALFSKEKLKMHFKKLLFAFLPEAKADRVVEVCRLTQTTFSKFLTGQCLEAVILGTLFFITMSIIKLPYALLISVIIAVTALIPIFGAFVGCAVGAFLIVMVNPMQAVWFIIMFLVLQQIEGNLIYPHVVGNSVGLPAIWVVVAVTVGGGLFGVLGMLLFIPLTSVLYVLLRQSVQQKLKLKKINGSKWTSPKEVVAKMAKPKPPEQPKTQK